MTLRDSTMGSGHGIYPSLQGLTSVTNVVLTANVVSAEIDTGVSAGEAIFHLWGIPAGGGTQHLAQYSVSGSAAGVGLPVQTAWPILMPQSSLLPRYAAVYVSPERRFIRLLSTVTAGFFWVVSRS
jgi:hypothetical protein